MTTEQRPLLLQIPEAADMLGVPTASLRAVADQHGKTIRMGRAVRLHPDDLGELIDLCRCQPRERALSCESARAVRPSTSSETRASPNARQAQTTAEKLKASSQSISRKELGEVVRLKRQK